MKIQLQNVSFQYDCPPAKILENINLTIDNGDVVALMGTSGSGKSTLIKIISSFLKPTSGQVLIDGKPIQTNKPFHSLAYVSQSATKTLFPWLTVENNIYYPCRLRNNFNSQARQYCDSLLATLKLEGKRKSHPLKLSGGEQKRLSLAIALSYKPEIILLDEPFSGIDFKLTASLWDVLHKDFLDRKPAVLFVTHSLDEASVLAHKVIFLNNSKTILQAEKTVFDFENSPGLPRFLEMAKPKVIEYRQYLLAQFNASVL